MDKFSSRRQSSDGSQEHIFFSLGDFRLWTSLESDDVFKSIPKYPPSPGNDIFHKVINVKFGSVLVFSVNCFSKPGIAEAILLTTS